MFVKETCIDVIKMDLPQWPMSVCWWCHKKAEVGFYIRLHGYALNSSPLCLDCLATLHSITSPLSVLVQTGIDTIKKE